jgi:hypothetical protein
MSVVPAKQGPKLEFFENHIGPWTTNAVAIGTTSAIVTDLQTKTTAARAAYEAQKVALQAAKAATANLKTAMDAMSNAGAAIIDQVRAKARSGGDAVYNLAEIPVPATPATKAKPGTPTDFKAAVLGDGSLELTWKCNNPVGTAGTMYQVYRSAGGSTEFSIVGGCGQRKFVDNTIPAGATQLTYKVQGMRSTVQGDWATFNVFFGTNTGGAPLQLKVTPVKMAA